MPHSSSQTRNGFSDPRMDSPFKTMKWDKRLRFAVFLNKAKEKSDAAMAADTSLLFKALTGSPCQDTGRIFLNAVIEHSPERKQSIVIAPVTTSAFSSTKRGEGERGRKVYLACVWKN
ncbi:hypothetical protein KY284_017347 [Solanum tuberosum]|nr:hypothetical protein KY284_017347 [Solanum tuberosum]